MKINKNLLQEHIERIKMLSEYNFISKDATEKDSEEELILGEEEDEMDMEDIEAEFDAEGGLEDDSEFSDEELDGSEIPDEMLDEPVDAELDAEEDDIDIEAEPEVEADGDEVEIDVTSIVQKADDAKASAEGAKAGTEEANTKMDALMSKFDELQTKMSSIESEIEKRNPTPKEKLELRALDSYPYNTKLTDFWTDQDDYEVGLDSEEAEAEDLTLTSDDIDSDYNETEIKNSLLGK
jgi:hypothetical protein